ncbi:MAG: hypothetical protein MUO30_00385 [Anaerolineales bacterium]|nr:hypothetical protein [Anaerolineales bacterium]
MRSKPFVFAGLLIIASMILSACQPTTTAEAQTLSATAAPAATEQPTSPSVTPTS